MTPTRFAVVVMIVTFVSIIVLCTLPFIFYPVITRGNGNQTACAPTLGDQSAAYQVDVQNLPQGRVAGFGPIGLKNAAIIMKVASDLDLGAKGQLIGLVTAMQESTLGENMRTARPDENDDAGLFQLRVKPGWHADGATRDENIRIVNDPAYAARVFYLGHTVKKAYPNGAGPAGYHIRGLVNVPGWQDKDIGWVTYRVQGYKPIYQQRYRDKVPRALELMRALSRTQVTIGGQPASAAIQQDCLPETSGGIGIAGQWACPISPPKLTGYAGRDFGAPRSSGRRHNGNDIFGPPGTHLVAVADGTIMPGTFGNDGGLGGTRMWLKTDIGPAFYYAHLSGIAAGIQPGVRVKQGQLLGYMGNTGRLAKDTPIHLHFEMHPCGGRNCPINPAPTFRPACNPNNQQPTAPAGAVVMVAAPATKPGAMIIPVKGKFTSPFGYRIHPISRTRRLHTGQDIGAPNGTPIAAAKDGIVTFTGWKGGYGNTVIIDHGNGITTLYAHQSRIASTPGTKVRQGQLIGYVGTTGASTGNHLHWEVRVNGAPVNPIPYT